MSSLPTPRVVLATPRKLPRASRIEGRVVVLDIAFASGSGGAGFEKITGTFIKGLGDRLAAWVDHHDHELHARFANDPRFTLARKRDHGACPEMVTPERVRAAGAVDTIVCHDDLDGLYAAAKWLRGGVEPYPGADDDARVVDTRVGETSPLGTLIDRALRGRVRDEAMRGRIVTFLAGGATDETVREEITRAAEEFSVQEARAHEVAKKYRTEGHFALLDATNEAEFHGPFDKTLALLLGQKLARVAVVYDAQTVNVAAAFDSGIDLLALFGLDGGMPTRVSVPRQRLDDVLNALRTRL